MFVFEMMRKNADFTGRRFQAKATKFSKESYFARLALVINICYLQSNHKASQAIFGHAWPLVSNFAFSFVLATIFLNENGTPAVASIFYISSGLMIWNVIADNINSSKTKLSGASAAALHNGLTIREFLVMRVLLNFYPVVIITPFLLLSSMIFFPAGFKILLIVPYMAMLFVFALSLSIITFFVSTLFPKSSDLLAISLRFLFFLSPVFWSKDTNSYSIKNSVHDLNPLSYVFELYRAILGLQNLNFESFVFFIITLGISIFLATLGVKLFGKLILNVS